MRENATRQRRRSVKFVDTPPEVVRFSCNQPSWIIPLTTSASTPSLNILKKSELDSGNISLISRSRAITLRRRSATTGPRSDERCVVWNRRATCPVRPSLSDDRQPDSRSVEMGELSAKYFDEDLFQLAAYSRALAHSCDSLRHLNVRTDDQLLAEQEHGAHEDMVGTKCKTTSTRAKVPCAIRPSVRCKNNNKAKGTSGCLLIMEQVGLVDGAEVLAEEAGAGNEISATGEHIDLEMARHVAECLKQFNTGLDMILQARQLLESSQHLPSDDRETMLRILNQGIRTGRKRLDVTDDRYEPDGGRSDSPNSISSQRPNATHPSPGGDHPQQMTSTALAGDIDPAVFFQQHGHQLLALLQQNMAKQN
ncbi:unnamed protein product [Toxocara canis]|uniref:Uncharacterized protein n=1 Tax=Toxocara canis TaxID=6265 RepID=A0A183UKG6_TOXCA|nr:unnamed protein product [Toxocara canis]